MPLKLWCEDVQWKNLAIYYVALIVPFFAAGLAILRIFSGTDASFGRIYAADLLGAGIGCLLLAPLSGALGMPFPTVIDRLSDGAPGQIPLAWALNGYGTVVGSASCILLAVFFGFQVTYATAAALYVLGAFTTPAS